MTQAYCRVTMKHIDCSYGQTDIYSHIHQRQEPRQRLVYIGNIETPCSTSLCLYPMPTSFSSKSDNMHPQLYHPHLSTTGILSQQAGWSESKCYARLFLTMHQAVRYASGLKEWVKTKQHKCFQTLM